MPVVDALTKTDRLMQVQILLRRKRDGVRTAEVADILQVSERTARRYMDQLIASGLLPAYKEGWVWRLVEGARARPPGPARGPGALPGGPAAVRAQ